MLHIKYNKTVTSSYWFIIVRIVSAVIISAVFSVFIWVLFWNQNKDFMHTILEFLSICIGVATFLIVWSKFKGEASINSILGFGFLLVSLFDLIHTYYYKYFIVDDLLKGELSIRYWMIARFIEVVTLLVFSFRPYIKNANKHLSAAASSVFTLVVLGILYVFPNWLPTMYDGQGVTDTKVFLEYLVIVIAILSLLKARINLQRNYPVRFDYIYICIILIIPSEICFTLFKDSGSFWVVYGHVLKIARYWFLYKGVFESLINYPYAKSDKTNQKLSDILNAVPIPIHTFDNLNRIDFVNKQFEELFKCPKERLLGLTDLEALKIVQKTQHCSENTLANRVKNNEGNTRNIIRTYLDCTGREVKVLVNAHKIEDGVLVLSSDIRQEQELQNLNLQAQTILDSIIVPTMIIDYRGSISACNNTFAALFEMNCNDIIGIDVHKLFKTLHSKDSEQDFVFDLTSPRDNITDLVIETPRGNKRHIQSTFSVIANIYGEQIGTVCVMQDISKIKEEQLKLINQEKLALLGQMGATIVHETRNFLTTIKGNSQLIEQYTSDEKIKQYAKKINADTNEVNRIISDFLALSRPRETQMQEVAFNDLIDSMKSTIETSSLMNKVQLVFDLDFDERYILCDETQIRQVMLNICKNAVEAMEDTANPVMRICTGLSESTKEVFAKISDNGKGIDPETLKKLGSPFFTTKQTGTGLGLSACYQIIQEHNGKIEVESQLGTGSTFKITMPFIDEDLEDII